MSHNRLQRGSHSTILSHCIVTAKRVAAGKAGVAAPVRTQPVVASDGSAALRTQLAAANEVLAVMRGKVSAAEAERDRALAAAVAAKAAAEAEMDAARKECEGIKAKYDKTREEVTAHVRNYEISQLAASACVSYENLPSMALGRDEKLEELSALLASERDPVARGKIASKMIALREGKA